MVQGRWVFVFCGGDWCVRMGIAGAELEAIAELVSIGLRPLSVWAASKRDAVDKRTECSVEAVLATGSSLLAISICDEATCIESVSLTPVPSWIDIVEEVIIVCEVDDMVDRANFNGTHDKSFDSVNGPRSRESTDKLGSHSALLQHVGFAHSPALSSYAVDVWQIVGSA